MIFLTSLAFGAMFERPLSLSELAQTSTAAAHGQVVSTQTEQSGGLIWTVVTLEVWEGINTSPTMTFRIPGGCNEGLCLNVSGAPSVNEGDQVVVFLRGEQVNNFTLGLFHVDGDRLTHDFEDVAFLRVPFVPEEPTLTAFRQVIQKP